MTWRNAGLGIAAALALGGAARAETASFGDWTVVCDNVRDCTAFGFVAENGTDGYIVLAREGLPAAGPKVRIATREPSPQSWRLTIDGKPIPGLGLVRAMPVGAESGVEATLTPQQSALVAAAVRNGKSLGVSAGRTTTDISLAGSSAALRWMDDRQKRVGTTTALVATGPRASVTVPPQPLAPVIRAGPVQPQTNLPKTQPAAIRPLLADCEDEEMRKERNADPIVARVSPGTILWGEYCSSGAYNILYAFWAVDEETGEARPLVFGEEDAGNVLMNVDFDPRTQTLSNFDKGRGLGDCGAETDWVWNGHGFSMKRQTLMPECRGVLPSDWPVSFRSR